MNKTVSNIEKEKYIFTRDREQPLSPFYWVTDCYTHPLLKKFYGIYRYPSWISFRNNRYMVFYRSSDWQEWSKHVGTKLYEDEKYFKKIKNFFDEEFERSKKFFNKNRDLDLNKKSFDQLIKFAKLIKNKFQSAECVSTSAWFVGGDVFISFLKESLDIPEDDFLFLTTPIKKTLVSSMEYNILKYSFLVADKRKTLNQVIRKLEYDYGTLPFNYNGPEYWCKDYFSERINTELNAGKNEIRKKINDIEIKNKKEKNKRKKLIKLYGFEKKSKEILERLIYITTITDDRKLYLCRYMYLFSKILWEIEKRYKISYKNLCYLFIDELEKIPKQKEKMIKLSESRIRTPFILCAKKGGKHKILAPMESKKIFKEIDFVKNTKEIKGVIASKCNTKVVNGKVKIVMSPKECFKVNDGDILVTTMTTPAYILAMKKSSGIITDEGGVTCHAAIISRELSKPCIIGTKIATKILNDGDEVEIDLETGIINIKK